MRFPWRAVLGVAVSAALLYWALHGVEWSDVAAQLRTSNRWMWVAAIGTSLLTFPLRARRWRIILDPVAPNVAFGPLWRAVAVGMMANNILPGRIGELTRAYTLSREVPRVPFTVSLASLVVDRAFDAIVVLALLLTAMFDPAFTSQTDVGGKTFGAFLTIVGGVLATGLAGLYFAVFAPARVEAFAAAFARAIAPATEPRVRALVHTFVSGLGVLRDPKRFAGVFAWTLAHWLVNAFAFWLGFRALGIDVPITAAFFVQGLIVIGVSLPGPPGFFGVFEGAGGIALAQYAIGASNAFAWALGYHILTFIPITLIGMWYVARLGLTWRQLGQAPGEEPRS